MVKEKITYERKNEKIKRISNKEQKELGDYNRMYIASDLHGGRRHHLCDSAGRTDSSSRKRTER